MVLRSSGLGVNWSGSWATWKLGEQVLIEGVRRAAQVVLWYERAGAGMGEARPPMRGSVARAR